MMYHDARPQNNMPEIWHVNNYVLIVEHIFIYVLTAGPPAHIYRSAVLFTGISGLIRLTLPQAADATFCGRFAERLCDFSYSLGLDGGNGRPTQFDKLSEIRQLRLLRDSAPTPVSSYKANVGGLISAHPWPTLSRHALFQV